MNIITSGTYLFIFITSLVKGETKEEKKLPSNEIYTNEYKSIRYIVPIVKDLGAEVDIGHDSKNQVKNKGNSTNDTHNHNEKRRAFSDGQFHTLSAGYNNGYSLGSGYSSGLLLPTGSGLGTRFSSGLGYQTSGYGPVLGVGSGLGIASGLNSVNSIGMGPVGLTPSTVVLGGTSAILATPLSYSSSGYSPTPSYASYPSSYSSGQYPYYKSYEGYMKPQIITKEVPVHITKEVPVHIPQPYPITVTKDVPYPVPQPYAVPVLKPYPVHVPHPIAVPIEKHVPYKVDRPVLYPYPQPVPYPVVKTMHVPYPVKTVVVPLKNNDYDQGQVGEGLYSQNGQNNYASYSPSYGKY